jgi:DNA replication and repair protein RecF
VLNQISISSLRNISNLSLSPSSGINLILGENGSGKTSVLEAIHLLALGRSFRTRFLKNIVKIESTQLQVVGQILKKIPVGLQYSQQSGLQIRLNSAPLKKLSELVSQLPLQLIPANCHQFFEQGPKYRRQFVDWGLFHVEHDFNYHWQSYKKILQQRNSALKQHKPFKEIQLWDASFVSHGDAITELRKLQLKRVLEKFKRLFPILCPEFKSAKITLSYRNGWPKESDLNSALAKNIERDNQLGYTRNGPHAADWSFKINDADPIEMLSRGQQKLFFIALCMSQSEVKTELAKDDHSATNSILLIDDISSELDETHQQLVLAELAKLPIQCFITSTQMTLTDVENTTVFHVKQGELINQ